MSHSNEPAAEEPGSRSRDRSSAADAPPPDASARETSRGREPRATAVYLYGLLRAAASPPVAGVPPGLPGASPPRAVAVAEGLWLVLADVPLPEYGGDAIEARLEDLTWVSDRALAHEAVVEHFRDADALLPMKLFTLFADEGRALADVRRRRAALESILERVAGCAEWGVRVRYEPALAAAAAAAEPEADRVSGTDFLRRKKNLRDAGRQVPEAARQAAEEAYAAFAAAAAAARRHPVPATGPRLLVDAAFLVAKADHASFDAAVADCAGRLRDAGCDLALTGPWPPYNFAAEEG